MDYCHGGSIRTLVLYFIPFKRDVDKQMEAGRFEERYIAIIMREVLLALAYVHKCGIIHRDIKGVVRNTLELISQLLTFSWETTEGYSYVILGLQRNLRQITLNGTRSLERLIGWLRKSSRKVRCIILKCPHFSSQYD